MECVDQYCQQAPMDVVQRISVHMKRMHQMHASACVSCASCAKHKVKALTDAARAKTLLCKLAIDECAKA